jgi:hypothetical protein
MNGATFRVIAEVHHISLERARVIFVREARRLEAEATMTGSSLKSVPSP